MAKKQKFDGQATEQVTEQPKAEPVLLVLGAKAPKHRAGHNSAAWSAMLPLLPATAEALAALPEVQICGGPKMNGLLMVGYCIRRGWLAKQA
jgi:hypothetical protein